MAWECAECNADKIEVVCHHCGKPLCGRDRILLEDDAFSDREGPVSSRAFHCGDCKQKHHPTATIISLART